MDLTKEQKAKCLRRVIYSINMLVYTYRYLSIPLDAGIIKNCFIESFLTHTRNLNCFFCKRKWDDDIVIEDFTLEFSDLYLDTKINKDIDKYLSHLTFYNIDQKAKWNFPHIVENLFPICLKFLTHKLFNIYKIDEMADKTRENLIKYLKSK